MQHHRDRPSTQRRCSDKPRPRAQSSTSPELTSIPLAASLAARRFRPQVWCVFGLALGAESRAVGKQAKLLSGGQPIQIPEAQMWAVVTSGPVVLTEDSLLRAGRLRGNRRTMNRSREDGSRFKLHLPISGSAGQAVRALAQ